MTRVPYPIKNHSLLLLALVACVAGCDEAPVAPATPVRQPVKSQVSHPTPAPVEISTPDVMPQFRDVGERRGISFRFHNDAIQDRFFLPEVMGGGVAWIDYDGDGLLDLYI
ncbi:MAG: hypothetical protein CMJ78_25450, partial [Planctomycetaceae bacterium]|nr:hypothetical protein [Planctomycetaceae bacterium]